MQVSLVNDKDPTCELSPAPSSVHISRKLESGLEQELDPGTAVGILVSGLATVFNTRHFVLLVKANLNGCGLFLLFFKTQNF